MGRIAAARGQVAASIEAQRQRRWEIAQGWVEAGVVQSTRKLKVEANAWWAEYKLVDGWPASDSNMSVSELDTATVGFIVFLTTEKRKSPGVALATQSRVASLMGMQGFESPSNMPRTRSVRASLSKRVPAAVSVAAFGAAVFVKLLKAEATANHADSKYLLACYVLGYHALLRVSEMSIPSAEKAPEWCGGRGLMNEDVKQVTGFNGRAGMEVTLRWRKNNQRGEELKITLWGEPEAGALDPVRILRRVHQPGQPRAMLLREKRQRLGWRPLRADWVRKRVKAALASLGEDPLIYSSHSLRASGATTLIATGKWTPEMIMEYGGWKSKAVRRYFRAAMNQDRNAVGDMWSMFRGVCGLDAGADMGN
jgi:hypothetical protein